MSYLILPEENNAGLADNPWFIVNEGFDPLKEREVETLFSITNGYIGTRGSLAEFYTISSPATLINGLYTKHANNSEEELAMLPDWTRMQVYIDDNPINLFNVKTLEHKRYLDMKRGIFFREWKNKDELGRITNIKILKYISLHNRNKACKSMTILPENYSGRIKVVSAIDGSHQNNIFSLPEIMQPPKSVMIGVKTDNPQKVAVISQKSEFLREDQLISIVHSITVQINPFLSGEIIHLYHYNKNTVWEEWEWIAEYGIKYSINCLLNFFSSLDSSDPIKQAQENNIKTDESYFKNSINLHLKSLEDKWNKAAIEIEGDQESQKEINFAMYHLINSGGFSGEYSSIPARDLSGITYQGHIFWDTEMYMLPFYTLCEPEVARKLLMFRYHTLPGALENAGREGYKGASYAWESTDSGLEMTPEEAILPYGQVVNIYSGKYENHISPDIAYAIWQYWTVTGDDDFISDYGCEIVFLTARFCKSLMVLGTDGYYHIYNVIGPDEYHKQINDNAYTNIMAKYNIEFALELVDFMKHKYRSKYEKLRDKIKLDDSEIEDWKNSQEKIYSGYYPEKKLYEQFNNFFNLQYIDLKGYEPRKLPMDIILGKEITRNSQVIKQADVLMFLFLLGHRFSYDVVKANYEYYEPRTSHGSSLSPGIHSIIAARAGKMEDAFKYFKQNTAIYLGNQMGNASSGIHMAAIGGVWMSLVMGFAGMYIYNDGLLFDPHLPVQWKSLKFSVLWRKQKINIILKKEEISFAITGDQKLKLGIGSNNWRELPAGETYTARLEEKWKWIQ